MNRLMLAAVAAALIIPLAAPAAALPIQAVTCDNETRDDGTLCDAADSCDTASRRLTFTPDGHWDLAGQLKTGLDYVDTYILPVGRTELLFVHTLFMTFQPNAADPKLGMRIWTPGCTQVEVAATPVNTPEGAAHVLTFDPEVFGDFVLEVYVQQSFTIPDIGQIRNGNKLQCDPMCIPYNVVGTSA